MKLRPWLCSGLVALSTSFAVAGPASAADTAAALAAIREVGTEGKGHGDAAAAVASLAGLDASALPAVLAAMDGANPLAKNWLFGVAGTIADRGTIPTAELEKFFADTSHDADARYWVFQLLTKDNAQAQSDRLDTMLTDPGAELKYLAVEHYLKKAEGMKGSSDKAAQVVFLSKVLEEARYPAQIQKIAGLMKDLESPIDLQRHFGFIPKWYVVGPFDNKGQKAFDVAYPPEQAMADSQGKMLDINSSYPGKEGKVSWQQVSTDKEDGTIDLNPVYNKEKGAICYALATFQSAADQPCEVRLGCTNANQVWLNGEKVISNEVYHTGGAIDQYTAPGMLKKGENTILIKVCQNEQTEPWAQDFAFQLRITDLTGKAIQSVE